MFGFGSFSASEKVGVAYPNHCSVISHIIGPPERLSYLGCRMK